MNVEGVNNIKWIFYIHNYPYVVISKVHFYMFGAYLWHYILCMCLASNWLLKITWKETYIDGFTSCLLHLNKLHLIENCNVMQKVICSNLDPPNFSNVKHIWTHIYLFICFKFFLKNFNLICFFFFKLNSYKLNIQYGWYLTHIFTKFSCFFL
jgi:hypothetical protein